MFAYVIKILGEGDLWGEILKYVLFFSMSWLYMCSGRVLLRDFWILNYGMSSYSLPNIRNKFDNGDSSR